MIQNIFSLENLTLNLKKEYFQDIVMNPHLRIEKIISSGQATPLGEWLVQDWEEFVILLEGSAGLSFENDKNLYQLKKGDYIFIPSNTKHRVEYTDKNVKTFWLAVHINTM